MRAMMEQIMGRSQGTLLEKSLTAHGIIIGASQKNSLDGEGEGRAENGDAPDGMNATVSNISLLQTPAEIQMALLRKKRQAVSRVCGLVFFFFLFLLLYYLRFIFVNSNLFSFSHSFSLLSLFSLFSLSLSSPSYLP